MVSQMLPVQVISARPARNGRSFAGAAHEVAVAGACASSTSGVAFLSAWGVLGHGPLRGQLHDAARRQGACFDSGAVSFCAHARRVRRPLLLSHARPDGGRCRRQRAACGDQQTDRTVPALCGRERGTPGRALRHERDAQDRRRGPCGVDGGFEGACRDRRVGRVRRSWSQVSAVGAGALPYASREGHCDGACVDEASRLGACGRSTGMMTGRGAGQPDVAGGLALHVPVLVRRVVEYLALRDGSIAIDGTFGAGGYTRAILAAASCRVIALDRDPSAAAHGAGLVADSAGRLTVVEDRFSNLDAVAHSLGCDSVDGVVLDIGVSSMQLDTAERGFSFRLDGPLDMRMESDGPSAADVVATASDRDLAAIIATLG